LDSEIKERLARIETYLEVNNDDHKEFKGSLTEIKKYVNDKISEHDSHIRTLEKNQAVFSVKWQIVGWLTAAFLASIISCGVTGYLGNIIG